MAEVNLIKIAEMSVLHYNSGLLLCLKFRAAFVADKALDGASNAELRERYRKIYYRHELVAGSRCPRGPAPPASSSPTRPWTVVEDAVAEIQYVASALWTYRQRWTSAGGSDYFYSRR